MKIDKKYIGDRVQQKLDTQKKPIFGTIIEMREEENLGKRFEIKYRDERCMVYLVKWDCSAKERHSWVKSHLLVPLWPHISKNSNEQKVVNKGQ